MSKIRVLVVDDSVFMRNSISKIITSEEIEVIATANNGQEAIEKVKSLNPDIVTMDIEMPVMDGLTALKYIMDEHPVPIMMLSTLTTEGADATIKALDLGAIDFVPKKAAFTEMNSLKDELISKITEIARSTNIQNRVRRRRLLNKMNSGEVSREEIEKFDIQERLRQKSSQSQNYVKLLDKPMPAAKDIQVIGIGVSTGGPAALNQVVPLIDANIPVPILIAQHMPPHFTKSLAERLDSLGKITVKELEHNEKIHPGIVYIGPGGKHFKILRNGLAVIGDEPQSEIYRPSANVMFQSISEYAGGKALGVIMTGMGDDGKRGLSFLSRNNGYVISQDYESCIVNGMPSAAVNAGVVSQIIQLNKISSFINSIFR